MDIQDEKLDQISNVMQSLHTMASDMGQEIDTQNSLLSQIEDHMDHTDARIQANTMKAKKLCH